MGGNVVKEIFEDSKGNLWIGHWFSGISRLDRATGTFKRFVHDPDNGHSLPPGAVFEITEDSRGNIWVGTLNGERTADAAMLSFETGRFHRIFTCEPEGPECPKPESQADRPENHYVVSIFESPDGAFWFGGGELTRLDPEANTYQSYLHRFAPESEASYLLSDGANGFWLLSSSQGLFHFNPESNELSNYRHDKADSSSIASDILNTPFRDRDGSNLDYRLRGRREQFRPGEFELWLVSLPTQ